MVNLPVPLFAIFPFQFTGCFLLVVTMGERISRPRCSSCLLCRDRRDCFDVVLCVKIAALFVWVVPGFSHFDFKNRAVSAGSDWLCGVRDDDNLK